jgi:group I intron endonuclease
MKYNNNIIPILTYNNMDINKSIIILNNKIKCGIYRLNNIITGKSYIGSSVNLASRFSNYYSIVFLENRVKKGSSIIYNSLLKYGYSNFSVDILEYCESYLLIAREQYYMDILKPEYNILKAANSRLGSKHTLETKALMSIKLKGINNPSFGKTLSQETRIKISESLKSSFMFKNSIKLRLKNITHETKLKRSLRSHGVKVKVYDIENNLVKEFPTMTSVALQFNISSRTVGRYLDKDKAYNGYTFRSNFNLKY